MMDSNSLLAAALVWSAIGGTLGYFIGKDKGFAQEGAWWGILLGVIGVIIVLIMKDRREVNAEIDRLRQTEQWQTYMAEHAAKPWYKRLW